MRWKYTLFLLLAAAAPAAWGQTAFSTVKIYATPAGLPFYVDGTYYTVPAVFSWPAGSKHTLAADAAIVESGAPTRHTFASWTTNGDARVLPLGRIVTITADPALTYFRADFTTEYALDIRFHTCNTELGACPQPGFVYAQGEQLTGDTRVWGAVGSVITLQAVPASGYVFLGWVHSGGATIQGFINSIRLTGPALVSARFAPARIMQLDTSPTGLLMLIDRATVMGPLTQEWGYGTVHTVAPLSPQQDGYGRNWVFQSWSDGGAATHAYTMGAAGTAATLTATYVPGARVTFMTSPPGLELRVDGRDHWTGYYNYTFGVGETHRAEAPAEQTGPGGRRYVFQGWSNGSTAAAQDVLVSDADVLSGVRLTAMYQPMGRLSLETSVSGLPITVDDALCAAPCVLDRAEGTQVRIAVPAAAPEGEDSRYVFQGWNDAAGAERLFTFTGEAVALRAAYGLTHRLVAAADPPAGARWHYEPESPDGFYGAGSQVSVRVEARPGYRFRRLEGDLAGAFASGMVDMTAPRYVRAFFDRVPYIAEAGVRNAAAETPSGAVAPGSVVAIVGGSLAATEETGPVSPLAQTLAGVTVRLADRMLPLFYASPELITIQLPSDLEPGEHTLAVKPDGQPEVRAGFVVARNAPGLFRASTEEGDLAVAAHADGSAVSAASPARRGEVVTLYGTGLGPCDRRPPDGFAVPAMPVYTLADPVEIVTGEAILNPLWAGAAPGRVGVNEVRLHIAPELPSGALPLLVRVNGQDSNTVLLPVE